MHKFQNYSADGKYYISTVNPHGRGWETCVFAASNGVVDYSRAFEEVPHSSEESAKYYHQRAVMRWSGDAHPEDIIGIGEGFY